MYLIRGKRKQFTCFMVEGPANLVSVSLGLVVELDVAVATAVNGRRLNVQVNEVKSVVSKSVKRKVLCRSV